MLSQVVELIETKNRFAITSHVRPDGDGLGSSLGLFWLLSALGKEAEVITCDSIPQSYAKLPGADKIRITPSIDRDYDAVFVIECSDIERPGLKDLEKQLVVNIDHHSTCDLFGDINWIDPTASAVGEMIYNLCKAMGVRVSKEIAECVYTALMTDTGSFHYSNTTDRTFKVASELVKAGAQPAKLSEAVYNSYLGQIGTSRACDGNRKNAMRQPRIACMRQSLEMLETTGADECDGDGFVNILLTAGSIEAAAFLKEKEPGVYRTSLRSKGDINVARVAEKLGGGGHRNAAGCTLRGTWEEAESTVIQMLNDAIEKAGGDVDRTEDALIHPTVTANSKIEAEVRR